MILERGGRSDKLGNIYELHCAIYLMLDVISGKEYSITVEPLGDDEIGTDIIVTDFEGNKCLVQCKASNGGKNDWSISDLKSRGILKSWAIHLNRNRTNTVEILSPCSAEMLETLISRVRNTSSDPLSFYKYQVSNNEKLKSDYKKFCEGFSITIDNIDDANKNNDDNVRFEKSAISKSIDYLRRIKINRKSLNDLNEWIELKTEHLFSSEKDKVFNLLKSIFDSGENFGREITIVFLKELFDKSGVFLRAIEDDTRVYQRLFEINNEYEIWSRLIDDTLIERPEFEKCISLIENDQSFIISGQAGMGKSGCTEAIIRYCVNEKIPYIALKLDRKTPQGSLGKWSNDIGFPYSFVEVVNRLSVSTRAVIILDQLDALRWTLPNSRQALDVCVEIINAVKLLNKTRQKKICIVFVCRKYDLENDSNIKALFEKKVSEEECKVWEKVEIGRLSEENVKKFTGEYYFTMSEKMKSLIAIPSNMFIWKKIGFPKFLRVSQSL